MKIMTSNEMEPFFYEGGLRNFLISTPSQKKTKETRMPIKATKKASVCKRSHLVSVKVQTTPGTKHPVIEGVGTIEEIHLNLNNQDTEFKILLGIMRTSSMEQEFRWK